MEKEKYSSHKREFRLTSKRIGKGVESAHYARFTGSELSYFLLRSRSSIFSFLECFFSSFKFGPEVISSQSSVLSFLECLFIGIKLSFEFLSMLLRNFQGICKKKVNSKNTKENIVWMRFRNLLLKVSASLRNPI